MNKLVALVALGLIVGGFLLVTFSYAGPTSPTGTNGLPDISDMTHGAGTRPDPPNDYVPSTPPAEETTPPPESTPPPDTTPPPEDNTPYHEELEPTPSPTTPPPVGETYVTKYILQNQQITAVYNSASERYEGKYTVSYTYPVDHKHDLHAMLTLSNGMSIKITHHGTLTEVFTGPLNNIHEWIPPTRSTKESVTVEFFIYGSNAQGKATVSLYVTEWPSSQMSIFGTQTNDMTIGVVMLIAGFAALLLFGKR